jgi:hypothetical protein
MARRKVNVSAAIKEYITKNPSVGPTDAAKAVSESLGKKVSATYVSNIKSTMGKSKQKSGGRKQKATHSANGSVDLASLAAMKELLAKVGADTAKKMIEILA